jgi:PAS domain S-box-containing protein
VPGKFRELPVPNKEELFELLVESSIDFAIFTLDPDGLATSWNVGAERLFGFSEEQMLGRSADVIFTAEDRAASVAENERSEASIHGRATDERWHQRADGTRFWASGLMMPLKGVSTGFVKITRDRTEQHQAGEGNITLSTGFGVRQTESISGTRPGQSRSRERAQRRAIG